MNKKIWIICHYASPAKYGFGTRHFFLAEEFIKMGYEVTIFASVSNFQLRVRPSFKSLFLEEIINGVKVVWVNGFRYSDKSGFMRVLSWFVFSIFLLFYRSEKTSKPGTIIVSSISLIPVINGWLIKKSSPSSKLIMEIRDIWPLTLTDIGGYSKYHPLVVLLGWFEKFGYSKADHIVATMPKADLHIRSVMSKSFTYTCIPQGIDPGYLENRIDISADEKKMLFPEKGFVVGYAGALGISNSLETLIEAAGIINNTGITDIYFLLVGDGNAKDTLLRLSEGKANISFIPKIPRNKVQSFLENCDVLYDSVRPVKLYNYGLSRNKWMDYMLSGKPLLVSFSGYDELIVENNCGTIVPAGDPVKLAEAILEYYTMEKHKREEIGYRGRKFVLEKRNFESLAKEYVKLF